MLTKSLRFVFMLLVAMLMVACGGGGGSAGGTTSSSGSTSGGTGASTGSYDFWVMTDKQSLSNSGTDQVLVSVFVVDATTRNVSSGVTVTVVVDPGARFAPNGSTTDSNGKFTGLLLNDSSKDNRTVNVSVTVAGKTNVVAFPIVGSGITINTTPAAPEPNTLTQVNLKLTDASGTGMANKLLTISGSFGVPPVNPVQTDASGNAQFSIFSPLTTGTFSISVAGAGVTTTKAISVIANSSTGSSGFPTVTATISGAAPQAIPNSIKPNATGATTNRSTISVKFIDALNFGIANMRVQFFITSSGSSTGQYLTSGGSTVYSDATGLATTDYVAGSTSSQTNGVQINVCYSKTDAGLANCPTVNTPGSCSITTDVALNACGIKTVALTVGGTPVSITLNEGNLLGTAQNGIYYTENIGIQVVDSNGNPVQGAVVSASVDITHYGKAPAFLESYTYAVKGSTAPDINDTYTSTLSSTQVPTSNVRVWCVNEDTNRNGILDTIPVNEDFDGDGKMTPRQAEVSVSFPNGNTTDSTGLLALQVQYPQDKASWLAYTLKATTSVSGSEGTVSRPFVTKILTDDLAKPGASFRIPPYGGNACSVAN